MKNKHNSIFEGFSRRDFIKASAVASVVPAVAASKVHARGSEKIKVGMIGTGGRATGAMMNCFDADDAVELVAMCDLFQDRIDSSLKRMTKAKGKNPDKYKHRIKVTPEKMFTGFDGYKKLLAVGEIDLIVTATPPHFRPIHLKAIVEAGKHCFIEKPVAVDPVGIRSVIASSKLAKQKNLAIVAGTQRRHDTGYLEMIKRIRNGEIGEIVAGQCYWNMGTLWTKEQTDGMSDMEWQIRNWLYFTWLSGDHIVEQHVHNIDIMNWAFDAVPKTALGVGGRQVRKGEIHGNIFDHFTVEYEYPNGARIMSMCKQIRNSTWRVAERVVGTKGVTNSSIGKVTITGSNPYEFKEKSDCLVQEHKDLIASIRSGNPLNEGERIAMSTLSAIAGRISAYTARPIELEWLLNKSKLDLSPPEYKFGPVEVRPVAVPGKTMPV